MSVILDEDLHHPLRLKIAELDISFQAVLTDLLRDWVEDKSAASQRDVARAQTRRPENCKWHDMLDLILMDPNERIGVEKNLMWAAAAIEAKVRLAAPSRLSDLQQLAATTGSSGHSGGSVLNSEQDALKESTLERAATG